MSQRFYSVGPHGDVEFHATAEEAREAAAMWVSLENEAGNDNCMRVEWGEVTPRERCVVGAHDYSLRPVAPPAPPFHDVEIYVAAEGRVVGVTAYLDESREHFIRLEIDDETPPVLGINTGKWFKFWAWWDLKLVERELAYAQRQVAIWSAVAEILRGGE